MNWNVHVARIVFERIKNPPSVRCREPEIEQDCLDRVFIEQRKRGRTIQGRKTLEAVGPGHVEQETRESLIILHNENRVIAGSNSRAIILDMRARFAR